MSWRSPENFRLTLNTDNKVLYCTQTALINSDRLGHLISIIYGTFWPTQKRPSRRRRCVWTHRPVSTKIIRNGLVSLRLVRRVLRRRRVIRGAQRQENGATEGETLVHGLLPLTCKTCDGNDGADMRGSREDCTQSYKISSLNCLFLLLDLKASDRWADPSGNTETHRQSSNPHPGQAI